MSRRSDAPEGNVFVGSRPGDVVSFATLDKEPDERRRSSRDAPMDDYDNPGPEDKKRQLPAVTTRLPLATASGMLRRICGGTAAIKGLQKILVPVAFLTFLLQLNQFKAMDCLTTTTTVETKTTNMEPSDGPKLLHESPMDRPVPGHYSKTDIGQRIVQSSYAKSFGHLVKHCASPAPSEKEFRTCVLDFVSSQDIASFPWWFQTLLRDVIDGGANGVFGRWHKLFLVQDQTNLEMCVIEKVGTKHWQQLQCLIHPNPKITGCNVHKLRVKPSSSNFERSVFLRDPLERFLSAFLDKCTSPVAREQNHCQPKSIFLDPKTNLVEDFKEPSTFFEIYVKASPLRWNLHFFPQSLYCRGLYAHIANYTFVGHMDEHFYHDVSRFAKRFALEEPVENIFGISLSNVSATTNRKNEGVETRAATKTMKYYTAETVRLVLQYMAIDYVLLDLPIPEWAETMLAQEYDEYFKMG